MYNARMFGVHSIALVIAALVAGCTNTTTTAPSTTAPGSTNSSLVSVASSPPTFIVNVAGTINVTLTGNPTKTSSIKVDFGDSSPAVTMSAIVSAAFPHTYTKSGTYKVTATVTMSDNSVVSSTSEVSVLP
jgi:hypothetical protein